MVMEVNRIFYPRMHFDTGVQEDLDCLPLLCGHIGANLKSILNDVTSSSDS